MLRCVMSCHVMLCDCTYIGTYVHRHIHMTITKFAIVLLCFPLLLPKVLDLPSNGRAQLPEALVPSAANGPAARVRSDMLRRLMHDSFVDVTGQLTRRSRNKQPQAQRKQPARTKHNNKVYNTTWHSSSHECTICNVCSTTYKDTVQPFYKRRAHKLISFGSNLPGSCLWFGGFRPVEIRSRRDPP